MPILSFAEKWVHAPIAAGGEPAHHGAALRGALGQRQRAAVDSTHGACALLLLSIFFRGKTMYTRASCTHLNVHTGPLSVSGCCRRGNSTDWLTGARGRRAGGVLTRVAAAPPVQHALAGHSSAAAPDSAGPPPRLPPVRASLITTLGLLNFDFAILNLFEPSAP